jgi:hypothetical protein
MGKEARNRSAYRQPGIFCKALQRRGMIFSRSTADNFLRSLPG